MKLYDPDLVDILDDEMRKKIEKKVEGEPSRPYPLSVRWRLFWENLDLLQGQWTRTLCCLGYLYVGLSLSLFGGSRIVFDVIIIILFTPQLPRYNPVLRDMKCLFMYDEAVKALFYLNRGIISYFYLVRFLL